MSDPRITDAAVAEIAARMFDGDLIRQPQRVQDAVWRDARFALDAALSHLAPQPVVDREALEEVMDREICTCQSCEEETGYNEGARAVQKAVLALLNGGAS